MYLVSTKFFDITLITSIIAKLSFKSRRRLLSLPRLLFGILLGFFGFYSLFLFSMYFGWLHKTYLFVANFFFLDLETILVSLLFLTISVLYVFISAHNTGGESLTAMKSKEVLFHGLIIFLAFFSFLQDNLLLFLLFIELIFLLITLTITTNFQSKPICLAASTSYWLLNALASVFLWLGLGLFYITWGSFSIQTVKLDAAGVLDAVGMEKFNLLFNTNFYSMCFILGFFLKLGAYPLHFFIIQIYEKTPFHMLMFLLYVIKPFTLLAFIKVMHAVSFNTSSSIFSAVFYTFGLLILAFGSYRLLAIKNLKSFLISTSLANTGIILVGFATEINHVYAIFYLFVYVTTSLLFYFLISLKETKEFLGLLVRSPNFITELPSLYAKHPAIALMLGFTVLSLIGIPPFLGFFVKFMLLQGVAFSGNIVILLVFSLTNLTLGLFYFRFFIRILFYPGFLLKVMFDVKQWPVFFNTIFSPGAPKLSPISKVALWLTFLFIFVFPFFCLFFF